MKDISCQVEYKNRDKKIVKIAIMHLIQFMATDIDGAVVAEWLSFWLAEQEDKGSIPGLAT